MGHHRYLARLPMVLLALIIAAGCGSSETEQGAIFAGEDAVSALDEPDHSSFPAPLIDTDRILDGGPPPDGIPPIDDPVFAPVEEIDFLADDEAVLAFVVNGDARAYPIQIMTWHEIVNDTVGGVPATVSYCPLCNSALAYDRRVGGTVFEFGTSGRLYNSSLVMYDRQTESLWTHFDGRAVVGALAGTELETLPIQTVSWSDFAEAFPDGSVLTRDTGHVRDYGRNPYAGYDTRGSRPFAFDGAYDERLDPKERVIVVRNGGDPAVVVLLDELHESGVIEFSAHGRQLVAFVVEGTASPLFGNEVADGYDQGATAVFEKLEGQASSMFVREGHWLVDTSTGTRYDLFGRPDGGSNDPAEPALTMVEHLDTFWFAIAAFDENVTIVNRSS